MSKNFLSTVLLLDLVLDVQVVGTAEQMEQNLLLSGPGVVAGHLGVTEGGMLFEISFLTSSFASIDPPLELALAYGTGVPGQ